MSGGFNPVNLISQAALAMATGGASLVTQLAMQVVSQIANQVIQQLGQQLGLPQPIIDAAQGAFAMSSGNFAGAAQEYTQAAAGATSLAQAVQNAAEQTNASPAQAGELQRSAQDIVRDLVTGASDRANEARAQGGRGAESFLIALARALGQALDGKLMQMKALSEEMRAAGNEDQSTLGSVGAEIQAVSQEMKILSEALTNTLKGAGEGASTLARRG